MLEFNPINNLTVHVQKLVKNKLWLQVIIAVILGSLLGTILNPNAGYLSEITSTRVAQWLDLPGSIFLKLIQMVMIPLIFTSILSGIISNSSDNLKSMGPKLMLYFLFTTTIAIIIGAVVSLVFKPGVYLFESGGFGDENSLPFVAKQTSFTQNLPDTISKLIPSNPLESMLQGEMLGIVIFTVLISIAMTQLKSDVAKPMIRLSESIQKICMIVVSWAMLLVPYAVFGMMAALMSRIGIDAIFGLGYYIVVVLLGLLLLVGFYLLLLFIITGTKPIYFIKAVKDALLLAFSTASSAATMPLSMKVADNNLKLSPKISDFIIPIGASINMDGTALFQCITAIFMAQVYGIDLSILSIIVLTFTIVAASIGTPAVPGGGVIILASVLESTGIPTSGLIVIIGIDRILGMFRTTVNVTGDLVTCVVFNKWYPQK